LTPPPTLSSEAVKPENVEHGSDLTPLPTLLSEVVKPENVDHGSDLKALPTLSSEIIKPDDVEHGLVGQQYTHKGNQLGTWLRPVCNYEFDGFFREYRIDNLESNNNVDKLKKKLGKFVTSFTYQPETPDWYETSGMRAERWMLTFKVDDTKNVGKIQRNVERLLGNGEKVPCGTF